MNTLLGIWIFVAAVFQVYHVVEADPEVNVTVFYESLCPDSMRFIKKQLYPTYKVLKDYMNVELVPFGKAYYTTNPWRITCQHGRYECFGNTVQACALVKYPQKEQQIKFVHCVMSESSPPSAGKKCARRLKYNFSAIEQCTVSEEGRMLMAQMGDRTKSFRERLSFVPTILFNDKYSERDQKDALYDLKSVVCRKLEQTANECKRSSKEYSSDSSNESY